MTGWEGKKKKKIRRRSRKRRARGLASSRKRCPLTAVRRHRISGKLMAPINIEDNRSRQRIPGIIIRSTPLKSLRNSWEDGAEKKKEAKNEAIRDMKNIGVPAALSPNDYLFRTNGDISSRGIKPFSRQRPRKYKRRREINWYISHKSGLGPRFHYARLR